MKLLDTFKVWAEQIFGWYYFVERSVYEPYEDGHGGHYVTKSIRKRLVNKQYLMLLFDEDLMTFAMGNCIMLEDTNGNRKLLKKRYEQKIDAVAAMMDAYIAFKANREAFE